jgi:hypothetical protein
LRHCLEIMMEYCEPNHFRFTSAMYHKLLIWLSSNMNAKLFQRLPIGRGVETEHSSFKRYTALAQILYRLNVSVGTSAAPCEALYR